MPDAAAPRQLLPKALRYAEEVARAGSIQAAAKELSISASAIDRQILLLESDLGVPLFERLPAGMRLTAAGEILVVLARRWRSDINRIGLEIKQLQGVSQGKLKLAAMDSHTNGFLPRFVQRLAQQHPRIRLEIDIMSTDQAATALLEGAQDIAVAFNLKPQRDLHVVWSTGLPLGCVVAAGHPLAREPHTTLKAVAAYPLAVQGRSLTIRRYLESRHAWLFSEGEPPVVTNSLQLVKTLVQGGSHVAITSELDAAPEICSGALRFVPIRDKDARPQSVGVAISARRPLPRIARLAAEMLAEEIRICLDEVRGIARAA
jgi:DNA-binding transcriptional LysR family regulator